MKLLSILLVFVGALFILVAIVIGRRVQKNVPKSLEVKWLILTSLMCFFVFGYVGYIFLLLTKFFFPLELFTAIIFLVGALFVFGMIHLAGDTISRLHDVNENLENQVTVRTSELLSLNDSLVTSQKALQKQNAFLENILDALEHPFYVIDVKSYEIILSNRAANLEAEKGTTCFELTHGLEAPCGGLDHPCPIQKILGNGQPVVLEHMHRGSDGEDRNVEIHGYPIYDDDGNFVQMIEYVVDITKRRRAEEKLLVAKKEADSANSAKSIFLANMSHEIRTPMNAILGMTDLALETELSAEQKKYLSTIQESSELLLNIINDVLDLSKIEAGKLELINRPFHLGTVVESVFNTLSLRAKEKGLIFECENQSPCMAMNFMGDDLRLKQVLFNLIGNAIKFTDNGSVSFFVKEDESEGDTKKIYFSVTDTGRGVDPRDQEGLFDSFKQVDSTITQEYGGTGLGLSICKRLVHLLGGEIGFTSTLGEGSCFYFTVTFTQTNMEVEKSSEVVKLRQEVKSMDILIVDDVSPNRELMRMILEKSAHRVIEAENGLMVLEALLQQRFDVIFMDLQMPVLDGYKTTEIIRACEQGVVSQGSEYHDLSEKLGQRIGGEHIHIVAMTAHAMSGDHHKCLQEGMDAYISKPFKPDDIQRQLAKI